MHALTTQEISKSKSASGFPSPSRSLKFFKTWISDRSRDLFPFTRTTSFACMVTVAIDRPGLAPLTQKRTPPRWVPAVRPDGFGSMIGITSNVLAEPFRVEWALNLRQQCREVGVAFFLKQLRRHPMYKGRTLNLVNEHGGDWPNGRPVGGRVKFLDRFKRQALLTSRALAACGENPDQELTNGARTTL